MYGYQDDNVNKDFLVFGLNYGAAKMVKFEWTANGGKDGAEMEALDIVFKIGEKEISYKQFPVTKAYDNKVEITDPNHPAMKTAFAEFNAIMTHIIACYVSREEYVAGLKSLAPNATFKQFCETLQKMLPANYKEVLLDVFGQYQFAITGENTQTYLQVPRSTKHGKFLCRSIKPVGKWDVVKVESPDNNIKVALCYKDEDNNVHPFVRTGWYMNSNFAHKQSEAGSGNSMETPTTDAPESNKEEGNW